MHSSGRAMGAIRALMASRAARTVAYVVVAENPTCASCAAALNERTDTFVCLNCASETLACATCATDAAFLDAHSDAQPLQADSLAFAIDDRATTPTLAHTDADADKASQLLTPSKNFRHRFMRLGSGM